MDLSEKEGSDIFCHVFKLLENIAEQHNSEIREKDPRIVRAIQGIKTHKGMGVNIKSLAEDSLLSESRFTHLFKDEVGISVMRFAGWIRLHSLLLDFLSSDMSITEAAYNYGFTDSAHFSRTFKSYFGVGLKKIAGKKAVNNRLIQFL